ncbi:LysE family translocator [Nitrospirillum amazonense]|uniref:Threonine/homoserine/homoserine lactone efflux protein n=1 Tax=Nitrospirillum amazonense TaxID=28077 RepID=A0A560KI92_9PROT|nr:LysE family translocator [Nitrospirillum amazonense]MDG3444474.1 LysE family translocator [Nitrospirillum amazonense]TWB82922.1 threonine/homoserine/homoserine lactone efflux protein [Nitrospirillum amazonense]
MLSWQTLSAFAVTCFLLSATPGPNMLFAMGIGLRHGVRAAAWAGAGMCLALGAMAGLSAVGMAALLQASSTAFMVVKVLGVAYLLYLGVQAWRADPKETLRAEADVEQRGEAVRPADASAHRLLLRGLLVCGSNPKALIFMAAFFPQFIDAAQPLTSQLVLLTVLMVVIEFGWILTYAIGGQTLASRLQTPKAARQLNRLTGGLLIGAGGVLALMR